MKLLYCFRIYGLWFLLVCNAFVLCHVLTFVRYIGVYYTFGILDFVRNNEDFALSRFFPINFYGNFGRAEEYRSLYRGLRYTEVR